LFHKNYENTRWSLILVHLFYAPVFSEKLYHGFNYHLQNKYSTNNFHLVPLAQIHSEQT
jgi:hypothetical protein